MQTDNRLLHRELQSLRHDMKAQHEDHMCELGNVLQAKQDVELRERRGKRQLTKALERISDLENQLENSKKMCRRAHNEMGELLASFD
jgi:hypothetical protein